MSFVACTHNTPLDTILLRTSYVRMGSIDHPPRMLPVERLTPSIERRVVLEPEVRFIQFVFTVQLNGHGLLLEDGCMVSEGVVRVFRDWLELLAKVGKERTEAVGEGWWDQTHGESILWLSDQRHVGFLVSVVKIQERGQDGSDIYWIKFCGNCVDLSRSVVRIANCSLDLLVRSTYLAIKSEECRESCSTIQNISASRLRRTRSIGALRRQVSVNL